MPSSDEMVSAVRAAIVQIGNESRILGQAAREEPKKRRRKRILRERAGLERAKLLVQAALGDRRMFGTRPSWSGTPGDKSLTLDRNTGRISGYPAGADDTPVPALAKVYLGLEDRESLTCSICGRATFGTAFVVEHRPAATPMVKHQSCLAEADAAARSHT